MKYCRLVIVLALAFCLSVSVYAADAVPEFYRKSLNDDLPGRNGDLSDIEKEIKDQAQAVLTSLNVDAEKALADFSLDNAVKMAIGRGASAHDAYDNLASAKAIVGDAVYTPRNEYDSDFLQYVWKIPVAETENHYVFATLLINSPKDISISTVFAPKDELSDVTYLFDRELVSNILKESGLNVNYEVILPMNLPILHTDVVVFYADKVIYGIPFSARADLLGIENGKIYNIDELLSIPEKMAQEEATNTDDSTQFGGGSVSTDTEQSSKSPHWSAFVLPTVVTVAVACLVYWGIDRKTRSKNR